MFEFGTRAVTPKEELPNRNRHNLFAGSIFATAYFIMQGHRAMKDKPFHFTLTYD